MTRRRLFLLLAASTALTALAVTAVRARNVPRVATGFVASVLCSETFVSGLDPEKNFADTTAAMPGTGLISWALDYRVDRDRGDVRVSLFGFGVSRAVYRGALGCFLDHGDAVARVAAPPAEKLPAPLLSEIAEPSIVPPESPQLAAALDRAFAEPDAPPFRRTRAIVVVKDGRIVGRGTHEELLETSETYAEIVSSQLTAEEAA